MPTTTQQELVTDFIKTTEKSAKTNLVLAVCTGIVGISLLSYFLIVSPRSNDLLTELDLLKLTFILIIGSLLLLPSVIMGWTYGVATKHAHQHRKELIKLCDLDKAIDISQGLGDDKVPEKEKEMRCKIVQALLDRYAD